MKHNVKRPYPPTNTPLLTTKQVAERLAVSVKLARRIIRDRQLPHLWIGREYRVRSYALEEWIRKNTETM